MTSWSAEDDTASAAPGSRGALRYVRTTVARPKVSPASHHFVILLRMSRNCVTSAFNVLGPSHATRTHLISAMPGYSAADVPSHSRPSAAEYPGIADMR